MGGTVAFRAARRYRRAHRLRSGKRGVVAVIGTLLSLLVFFALFGIFLTQYVPLWMTDNEGQFSSAAATSFLELKSGIDTQYTLGGPPSLGTPFTMSSQGIPLMAQPTEGTLNFLPTTCPAGFWGKGMAQLPAPSYIGQPKNGSYCVFENQSLSIGPGGSKPFYQSAATGVLQMLLPNRYFSAETFFYENDGVVQTQSGGFQVMAFAPPFNVTRLAGNTTVSSSFLELFGNETTVITQGSASVYSHLRFSQFVTSSGTVASPSFTYTFEVGTLYPCAWARYLQAEMNVSGVPTSQYNWSNPATHSATVPYTGSCFNPTSTTTIIALNLKAVNYATMFYAGVQLTIGVGSS